MFAPGAFRTGVAVGQIFTLRGAPNCFVVFKDGEMQHNIPARVPRAASLYQPLRLCSELWNLFRVLREIHQNKRHNPLWENLGLSPQV